MFNEKLDAVGGLKGTSPIECVSSDAHLLTPEGVKTGGERAVISKQALIAELWD